MTLANRNQWSLNLVEQPQPPSDLAQGVHAVLPLPLFPIRQAIGKLALRRAK